METHSSILAWGIPMDWGAWRATVRGVAKSRTRLSTTSLRTLIQNQVLLVTSPSGPFVLGDKLQTDFPRPWAPHGIRWWYNVVLQVELPSKSAGFGFEPWPLSLADVWLWANSSSLLHFTFPHPRGISQHYCDLKWDHRTFWHTSKRSAPFTLDE